MAAIDIESVTVSFSRFDKRMLYDICGRLSNNPEQLYFSDIEEARGVTVALRSYCKLILRDEMAEYLVARRPDGWEEAFMVQKYRDMPDEDLGEMDRTYKLRGDNITAVRDMANFLSASGEIVVDKGEVFRAAVRCTHAVISEEALKHRFFYRAYRAGGPQPKPVPAMVAISSVFVQLG